MNIYWKSKAFTLVEVLISLGVSIIVLGLLGEVLPTIHRVVERQKDDTFLQWRTCVKQLDHYTHGDKCVDIYDYGVVFESFSGRKFIYRSYKDQLVRSAYHSGKKEGYEPFVFNLKDLHFKKVENGVLMEGTFKNGRHYTYLWPWKKAS